MRIIHLNTHAYGGAAMVARRLHATALASGVDSMLVTRFGLRDDSIPNFNPLHQARLRYTLRRYTAHAPIYKIGKAVQRALQPRNLANRPAGFEIFSPLTEHARYADLGERFSADILHLHWVAGFVDHHAFFANNRERRFVWTLHDMNPFTGGCHHSAGCLNFRAECRQCPQLAGTIDQDYAARVLAAKAHALQPLTDDQLVVVSPSEWLLELSQQSRLLSRFRHVHIENPSFTRAVPQTAAAPRGPRKTIAFISDNLRNPQKGVNLLLDAVRELRRTHDVGVIGIGQRADVPADIPAEFVGTVRDESRLAGYLAAADVVALPSAAENSPLAVIEALTCGTPVVAFAVGGVPELIGDESGVLVQERSVAALADGLRTALFERQFDRESIRRKANRFVPANVWQKYVQVYRELASA